MQARDMESVLQLVEKYLRLARAAREIFSSAVAVLSMKNTLNKKLGFPTIKQQAAPAGTTVSVVDVMSFDIRRFLHHPV